MTVSPDLQPGTMNQDPHPYGEGAHDQLPLTFGERAEGLVALVGQDGYVPTVPEFLELQHMAEQVRTRHIQVSTNYEEPPTQRRTEYRGPDDEPIRPEVATSLRSLSIPARWIQREGDEAVLGQVANALRYPDGPPGRNMSKRQLRQFNKKVDAGLRTAEPIVHEATKALVSNPDRIDAATIDRLLALSRISKTQLREKGVDVDAYLSQRGRASATVSVPGRGIFHGTTAPPRTEVGRAPVRGKSGEHITYPEPLHEGESLLSWL